ncbi:MAG: hypothetical protein R3332_00515 [Pseudohongiellaceae bacterium]|nr:hypothetical protein [Pseudohongiellaceae bacterium]
MIKSLTSVVALVGLISGASYAQESPCRDIDIRDNRAYVSIDIGEKQYPAMLTTSNVGMSVSRGLAKELDLEVLRDSRVGVVGHFGEAQTGYYVQKLKFTLFGKELEGDNLFVSNGYRSELSVSLRLFSDSIVQLDIPKSKVCFYPRKAIDLWEIKNIRMDSDSKFGTPVVQTKLQNKHIWLKISPEYTGGVIIDSVVADSLGLYEQDGLKENRDGLSWSGILPEFTFGPYELANVSVSFPKKGVEENLTTRNRTATGTHIRSSTASRGEIGMDVLRHFLLTMDLEKEIMHIYAE